MSRNQTEASNATSTNQNKNLQKRDDIVIINADKGGALTILDADKYVQEANRQLSDENNYRKLQHNPTMEHASTVSSTIDLFKTQHKISEKLPIDSR